MGNTHEQGDHRDRELFLDISTEVCPLTFVRTKLLIEAMKPGEIAEIRLQGGEPLRNVPRAISHLGHAVVSLVAEPDTLDPLGPHRLRIRKCDE